MDITTVHVDFKATISDGNYGNETYTIAYTANVDAEESAGEAVETLARLAREHVYAQLKQSPRDGVRQALETAEEAEIRSARERAEYEATQERRRQHSAEIRRQARAEFGLPIDDQPQDTPF